MLNFARNNEYMEYEGMFNNKKVTYNGIIESLGEYPSVKANGYKVWFGRTERGFIYVCYSDKDKDNAFVSSNKHFAAVFRFAKPFETCTKAYEQAQVNFSRQIKIPWFAIGSIIVEAIDLTHNPDKISYDYKDAKTLLSSLEPPNEDLFSF